MRILIAFVYLLIAYGSLFPFNFSIAEFTSSYEKLLSIDVSGMGDVLGNILLFVPLGFLYSLENLSDQGQWNLTRRGLWWKVFTFALILQVMQIALPQRDQNLLDAVFNLLGFFIGFYSVNFVNLKALTFQAKLRHLPVAIALTYFLSELSPFIPSLDFQAFKNSIKPLLQMPSLSIVYDLLIEVVVWLLVVRLLSFGREKAPLKTIVSLWLLMLLGKVIIYFNFITMVDVIAPIIVILLAANIDFTHKKATKIILALAVFTFALTSVGLIGQANFSVETFIPFHAYLSGQLYIGVKVILYKLFLFGAMLWLTLEIGKDVKKSAFLLTFLVAFLEFVQIFMSVRTTDLGDVVLVVIAYLLVRYLGDYLATEESLCAPPLSTNNELPQGIIKLSSQQLFFASLVIGFIAFYMVVNFILALPGVSYNVAELFEHNASLLDLFFFLTFLVLLSATSHYIVNAIAQRPVLSPFKLTALHVLGLAVIFLFLWLSVTIESIEDIVGASKMKQWLYANQTSTSFSAVLVNVMSLSIVAKFAQFLEFLCRFSALFGLIQLPLTIGLAFFNQGISKASFIKLILITVPLFLCCFYVVFITAVTDNLTELIASPTVLAICCVALAFFVAMQRQLFDTKNIFSSYALMVIVSISSWYVAQYAFEQVIFKYGYTFSAFDFLIGGGREVKISDGELILRWSTLIFSFQLLLVIGGMFYSKVPKNIIPEQRLTFIAKYSVIATLCTFVLYSGNRLFGEHLHWQTLMQYFTNPSQQGFSIDNSVAKQPTLANTGSIYLNDELMNSLAQAFNNAKPFDTIRLTKGSYNQAAVLKSSNISIIAESGAIIFGKTKQGKGALVILGDNTYIEGLECHSIYVPDNNGVCVRLEGKGITLNNVYFHHAQGGLLGSNKGGDIIIENSRFEHLGDGAFFHGIYTLSPSRLFIKNSYFLNNRNGGHEIKSRSIHTEITNSVIASSQSRDSRLIDIPNGGVLIVKDNILIEGPYSENHDLLSWGVEGIVHLEEKVVIEGNTIISDKNRARLISLERKPNVLRIEGNIVVGSIIGIDEDDNMIFKNRAELSILAAPFIPELYK